MSRRVRPLAIAAAAVVMVLLALASSSDHVALWDPPANDGGAIVGSAEADDDQSPPTVPTAHSDDRTPTAIDGWIVQLVAVALATAALAVTAVAVASWRPTSRINRRNPFGQSIVPLQDGMDPVLRVDGDAGRRALAEGPPRNAIVACWMQLERDATHAGLARREAETSAEFVTRVVASSSVDPAPIRELSALYREARFSEHSLDETHRRRAIEALARVEAALTSGALVPDVVVSS